MDPRPDYLDPDALARGEALGLLARRVVEGYRVGEHRSPFKGFAIEFAQHREYSIGDDPRHLDWKVLGRTDRYYVKQYEQDTNYVAHLAVDGSESMEYGSGKVTKAHYAKALAACLAHLILSQRDAAALHLCDEAVRETLPRTDSLVRIGRIMERLAAFSPRGGTRLAQVLADLARQATAKGIVVLLSDLFDDEAALEAGLQRLRFGGSETIVFHVLDRAELLFPFDGAVEFEGLEGTGTLKTRPADIRKSYLAAFEAYRKRVREICDRAGCHYVLADTSKPLADTLSSYLAFRQSLAGR